MKEKNELIDESLRQEDGFSSHSHGMAQDSHALETREFSLPASYGKDRLCLLPVNSETYHLYWELTEPMLHRHSIDASVELSFRIMDENSDIVHEFFSFDKLGKYYVNESFEYMTIYAEVGFYLGNRYIVLLKSNPVKTFSTQVRMPEGNRDVWIKKQHGWTEIVRSSLTHFTLGMSSDQYLQQIERLKSFSNVDQQRLSSSHMQGDNDD